MMGLLFQDALHDQLGTWAVAYISSGGADFGKIQAVARAVGSGDDSVFYEAWKAAAERLVAEADEALQANHPARAGQLLMQASSFYATAYHPLYGEPLDPRLVAGQLLQTRTFQQALVLLHPQSKPLEIPWEGHALPGFFIPAVGHENEVRPLVIFNNGYDATMTDMYFASVVAAVRRGYHCLVFDGPGQGSALVKQGLHLRPDWENVIKHVVDVAVSLPFVETSRIALSGWSLGGYLAPRGASGEPRIAACLADPGLLSMASGMRPFAMKLGASQADVRNLGQLDQTILDRFSQIINSDRKLHWSIVQRGFWVHGVNNLRDYFASVDQHTMEGRVGLIHCPTFVTLAEEDSLSQSASDFFELLKGPKKLIRFQAIDGAGDHCEMGNRSLLNRRALDWLDETFSVLKK